MRGGAGSRGGDGRGGEVVESQVPRGFKDCAVPRLGSTRPDRKRKGESYVSPQIHLMRLGKVFWDVTTSHWKSDGSPVSHRLPLPLRISFGDAVCLSCSSHARKLGTSWGRRFTKT